MTTVIWMISIWPKVIWSNVLYDRIFFNALGRMRKFMFKRFKSTNFLFCLCSYILLTVRPDNSTVMNCLKLLIRIARTDKHSMDAILNQPDLLENLYHNFLPIMRESNGSTKFYCRPQFLLLKLLRIIASNGTVYCQRLQNMGIWAVLKSYIFVNGKITVCLQKFYFFGKL